MEFELPENITTQKCSNFIHIRTRNLFSNLLTGEGYSPRLSPLFTWDSTHHLHWRMPGLKYIHQWEPWFSKPEPSLIQVHFTQWNSENYKLGLGRGLWMVPCLLPTCCWDKYQSFFAPSQQPFPCMADSLHGLGHCAVWILWRISATSLRQLFLDEVNQDSRVQHPPKRRCLGENAFQHR